MKYQVYYARNPTFREDPALTCANLAETHVFLAEVEAASLSDVYWKMQGEVWSPHAEADALIRAKGLHHTSMSVGDVIQAGDEFYEVAMIGFRPLSSGEEAPGG